MKIAILGTGMVGVALGTKLVQGKHDVVMGSRTANSEGGRKWLESVRGNARTGDFSEAASFGEIVMHCDNRAKSLGALRLARAENMRGKILIQVANPLDF